MCEDKLLFTVFRISSREYSREVMNPHRSEKSRELWEVTKDNTSHDKATTAQRRFFSAHWLGVYSSYCNTR